MAAVGPSRAHESVEAAVVVVVGQAAPPADVIRLGQVSRVGRAEGAIALVEVEPARDGGELADAMQFRTSKSSNPSLFTSPQ